MYHEHVVVVILIVAAFVTLVAWLGSDEKK